MHKLNEFFHLKFRLTDLNDLYIICFMLCNERWDSSR